MNLKEKMINENKYQKAIAVIRQKKRNNHELQEFKNLVSDAGYNPIAIILQIREEDPRFNIGRGKISVLRDLISRYKPDKVIFGNELKPNQFVNLLKELNLEEDKLIDRILLVLEIFERRAGTLEAKLQIELARAIYRKNIVKEIIKERKKREKPGFHGLGRYPIDVYQKEITKRITILRKKLAKMEKHRELHRKFRKKKGYFLVSIVGYTNAGKSTLLNVLTKSNVPVSDMMFTTLSTYSRKLIDTRSKFAREGDRVILMDTIGFVYNIPPFLIEAFKSTLEEIAYSDLILCVIDISEEIDVILKKVKLCITILNKIGAGDVPKILILNKIDKVNSREVHQLENLFQHSFDCTIAISAKQNIHIDKLKNKIKQILSDRNKTITSQTIKE